MGRVLPLLSWPGGRFFQAKELTAIIPPHDTYVEPFVGGATVFWNKEPVETEVLGDMNRWLIQFYDNVRHGGLRHCKPVSHTKRAFEQAKACGINTKREGACCVFRQNKMSYQGNMETNAATFRTEKELGHRVLAQLPEYERRLRHAHLRVADFEDTMRRWDSPTTLHYLDPPWNIKDRSREYALKWYHGQGGTPLDRVVNVAREMQGKVIIHYDDSVQARQLFNNAGLYVYRLRTQRGGGQQGKRDTWQLVATNFPLPKRIKR